RGRGQDADSAPTGCVEAGVRGCDDRDDVACELEWESEPERDVRVEWAACKAVGQHRYSPDDRPANHSRARKTFLRDVQDEQSTDPPCSRDQQPGAQLRPVAPDA